MEAKLADSETTVFDVMKDKDEVWNRIVQKYGLKNYKLEDLGTWDFLHQTLNREFDELTLVQKVVNAGFHEQVQTDVLFADFFDTLKNLKIIPEYEDKGLLQASQ